jgi:hypothetical protein
VSYVVPLARGALVPISALDTLDNRNFAFAIEGGKVTIKNVVVLASSGAVAAVSGLNDGDVVILSPPPGLIDGASVQPTMVAGAVPSGSAPDSSRTKSPNADSKAASPNAPRGAEATPQQGGGQTTTRAGRPAAQAGQGGQAGQGQRQWSGQRPGAAGGAAGSGAAGSSPGGAPQSPAGQPAAKP